MREGFLGRRHKMHWESGWNGGDNERITEGLAFRFLQVEEETQVVTATFKI